MAEDDSKVINLHCLLFLPKGKINEIANNSWLSATAKAIKGFALLPTCASTKNTDVMELFVSHDVEILTSDNCAPLQEAIARKDVDTLELMVESDLKEHSDSVSFLFPFPVGIAGGAYDYERVQSLFGKDAGVYRNLPALESHDRPIIDKNNAEIMEKLLNTSANLGVRSRGGRTLMHIAACTDEVILIDLLLKYGSDIDAQDQDHSTPLLLASKTKHLSTVSLLVERGAAVNAQDESGMTSLHIACRQNNFELAKLLLDNGADVNCKTKKGFTPLHFAIYFSECKEQLSLNGPSNNDNHGVDLSNASTSRFSWEWDAKLTIELLNRGAFINASASFGSTEGFTPLVLAVDRGLPKIIQCLLERGADVNIPCYGNWSFLKIFLDACKEPSASLANCARTLIPDILKCKPDLNNKASREALTQGILQNNIPSEITSLLLQYGFTVKEELSFSFDLLHIALCKNHINIVKELLNTGVSANAVYQCVDFDDEDYEYVRKKMTPLLTAIENHNNEIVRFLVDSGVDIFYDDSDLNDLESPLRVACQESNWEAVKILLQKSLASGSLSCRNSNLIALMRIDDEEMIKEAVCGWIKEGLAGFLSEHIPLSAEYGSSNMLKELIKLGGCIDSRDWKGKTALHYVSKRNCSEIVELLIKNGADIEAKCFHGLTPISHAARRGDMEVVLELLKYGAEINQFDSYGCCTLQYAVLNFYSGILEALLRHAFTDFQLICSTEILEFLSFDSISTVKSIGDVSWFDLTYEANKDKFQKLTKFLLCFLMEMKAALPDEDNLADFVARSVEPALQLFENDDLFADKYDIGEIAVDVSDLMEKNNLEINRLKMHIIDFTSISLYDILTKDVSQLTRYARNQKLVNSLHMQDLEKEFPIYGSVISHRMKNGIFRRKLVDQNVKLCPLLFKEFNMLPGDMKEKVFDYLDNGDLEISIHACQSIATAQGITAISPPN